MWNKKTPLAEKTKNSSASEAGFTLVEAVVAMFVLTIGLVGTAAAITYALEFGAISRNVTTAKSMVVASIEEIETLRNSRRLDFNQIANVGAVISTAETRNSFNGFSVGFKEVSTQPGPDGVNGTDDDLIGKGADNTFGTADDSEDDSFIRSGYQRQIKITNLNDSLKKVEVKIRYLGSGGKMGEITGVGYLNDEFRVTR